MRDRRRRLGGIVGSVDHYVDAYSQAGALRAGFDLYRSFDRDAADTRAALAHRGRLTVPCLGLYGEISRFGDVFQRMGEEVGENVTTTAVPRTGHWIAEENPADFAAELIDFDQF